MLVISDLNKAVVKSVVDYASFQEHWQHPGQDRSQDPGQNIIVSESTECLFIWMINPNDGRLYRQLAMKRHPISEKSKKGIPATHIAFTLATWFGFTGGKDSDHGDTTSPGPDWIIYDNGAQRADEKIMLIAQLVDYYAYHEAIAPRERPRIYLELHPWFSMTLEELRAAQAAREARG